jgi:hypothetical protein
MPHRRALGIALGLLALVILFASTSVTVDVVPSVNTEEARQAAYARARETRCRMSRELAIGGVVLLIPALWLAFATSSPTASTGRPWV